MKYEIFHSGYWEKELFLAPCQPRRTISLLGFPAGLWYSPHTRVRLVLSWKTQQYIRGTVLVPDAPSLSSLGSCTLLQTPATLVSPCSQLHRLSSMRSPGSAGLLVPVPGAAISLQTGSWATVELPRHFPSLTDHCPLLSYVPCLERCCFICQLGFRCFR